MIEFEWTRDSAGYRIETRRRPRGGLLALAGDGDEYRCVVAKGGLPVRYRPLDDEPSLFAILAATEPTAEDVMGFAERFGFLRDEPDRSTDPESWRPHIEAMRRAVDGIERPDYSIIEANFNAAAGSDVTHGFGFDQVNFRARSAFNLRVGMVRGRERPALYIEPPNLLSALWLQIAQHVTSDRKFRRCLQCGTGFVFGSGTGRRRSGHYCSDRCRKAAWLINQEQAT